MKKRILKIFFGITALAALISGALLYCYDQMLEAEAVNSFFFPPEDELRFRLATGNPSLGELYDRMNGHPLFADVFAQGVYHQIALADVLLEHGVDVNAVSKKGRTALMLVAMSGDFMGASYLVRHNADANIQDNEGKTALFHLPERSMGEHYDLAILHTLFAGGADPCHRDHEGRTAAQHYGPGRAAGRLIAEACRNPREKIAAKGSAGPVGGFFIPPEDWLRLRLALGLVDAKDRVDGQPFLTHVLATDVPHAAALADALLENGADITATDANGRTALMWTVSRGLATAVSYLLWHGAKPDMEDKDRRTTLFLLDGTSTREHENLAILHTLLAHGADPCHLDHDGRTAAEHYGPDSAPGRVIAEACAIKEKGAGTKPSIPTP